MLMDVIHHLRTSHHRPVEFNPDTIREDAHMFVNHDAWRLTPGDIVMCSSWRHHTWTIGRVHKVLDYSRALIEDPITGELCDVSNESFYILKNFPPGIFYSEDQRAIETKVKKAMGRIDSHPYRIQNVHFEDGITVITIRAHVWSQGCGYQPFEVRKRINKSDTIKSIVEALVGAGVGGDVWPGAIEHEQEASQ